MALQRSITHEEPRAVQAKEGAAANSIFLGSPDLSVSADGSGPSDVASAWLRTLRQFDVQRAAASARGDFAVGMHMEGGRSFLAVDRFAQQTLCYRVDPDGVRFAKRAGDLTDAQTPLDPQAIFDYLYTHVIPSPRTIFKGVKRLPPGHYAVHDSGALEVKPYWTPIFSAPSRPSFEALRDEFRALLRSAVQRHLPDTPGACFLSGGVDSSTIAGLVGEVSGRPASTYSIGFDAAGYDEMHYARIVARHFGTDHHEYYLTPDDLVAAIPEVAAHYDQPFGNSSALPAYFCARRARANGVRHLLAGDGGDELFGGNARYVLQRIFGWYDAVPAVIRHRLLEPFFDHDAVRRVPLLRKGSGYTAQARTPMPDRLERHNLLCRLGAREVLTAEFLGQVDEQAPLREQRDVWRSAICADEIDRTLAYDWRYTLAESDIPKVRETCQLAGIDVAFPMLDDSLLEFSMRLPAEYKVKGLKLRWFMKEALRGFLPDAVLAKKKHGFGLPFGVWVLRHPGLMRLASDSAESMASRGIVRSDFVRKLVSQFLPAHPGYYGEMVWLLMMLEQWLRHHAPGFAIRE
jgi:asparagine synthase (glutamine-hydrolysing)